VRAQQFLRNFCHLSGGKILGDLATLVLFIALSRAFGEEGLGRYSFAAAIGGFCLIATDFGLYPYTVREISRLGRGVSKQYRDIIVSRSFVGAFVVSVLLVGVFIAPIDGSTRSILALIGASQVFYALANGFFAFFVAHERMEVAALGEIATRVLAAVTGIAVIWFGGGLVEVAIGLAMANLISVISAYVYVTRSFRIPKDNTSLHDVFKTLRTTVPLAVVPILRQMSMRIDILLIGSFLGASMVGIYNAAYRVVFLLFPLFYFASVAILPGASTLYDRSRKEFCDLVQRALGVTALLSIPSTAGLWLIAPDVIDLLFGPQFHRSGEVLRLLSIQLLIIPNLSILSMALISSNREKKRVISEIVGLVLGLIAYSVLIPIGGLNGAVVAAILTQAAIMMTMLWALWDVIKLPIVGVRAAIAGLGSAAFVLPFVVLPPLPIYVVVPASVLIYLGLISCFRDVRENELRALFLFITRRTKVEAATEDRPQ
jgi:O-antigen/teichoic acid export membrane protein